VRYEVIEVDMVISMEIVVEIDMMVLDMVEVIVLEG